MDNRTSVNHGIAHRVSLLVMSLALIVVTLATQGPLGWKVAFPLIAIAPGISALTGWDPVHAAATVLWNGLADRFRRTHAKRHAAV